MVYNKGEVWFVEFPLEEDETRTINRPVIVLDENTLGVLSVKITKHSPRKEDPYDIPILYWQEANLRLASTARVSKVFGRKTIAPYVFYVLNNSCIKFGHVSSNNVCLSRHSGASEFHGVSPARSQIGEYK